jgi:hypothetical protein
LRREKVETNSPRTGAVHSSRYLVAALAIAVQIFLKKYDKPAGWRVLSI